MKKNVLLPKIIILACLVMVFPGPAAAGLVTVDTSQSLSVAYPFSKVLEVKKKDVRVEKLRQFLNRHKSPLAPYAERFIYYADLYGLPDWRLVPAITGVESTFGKHIPYNSYNAYGWANGAYSFSSWDNSIEIVTKTLKEKYYGRGAITIEQIGRIYAPPSQTWAGKVRFFMDKIDQEEVKEDEFVLLSFNL